MTTGVKRLLERNHTGGPNDHQGDRVDGSDDAKEQSMMGLNVCLSWASMFEIRRGVRGV